MEVKCLNSRWSVSLCGDPPESQSGESEFEIQPPSCERAATYAAARVLVSLRCWGESWWIRKRQMNPLQSRMERMNRGPRKPVSASIERPLCEYPEERSHSELDRLAENVRFLKANRPLRIKN